MQPIKTIPLAANRTQVWSQGAEQRAVHLIYDVSAYLDKWPGAVPSVAFERADGEKYAHAFEMDGTVVHIPLMLSDTHKSGMCKCMITLTRNDGIANTMVFYGTVTQGIDTLGETPNDAQQGVIEQVNDAARRAELAANRAEDAAQSIANDLSAKLDRDLGAENAGKLLYVAADGAIMPLSLGRGLQIQDGVLVVVGTIAPDDPDVPDEPPVAEEVYFAVGDDFTVTLQGVAFVAQDGGSVLLDNAVFTQQDDGFVLIN